MKSIRTTVEKIIIVVAIIWMIAGCSSEVTGDSDGLVENVPVLEMTDAEKEVAKAQSGSQLSMFADVVKTLKDEDRNVSFSPLNATMALSILANATTPEYAAKILNVMGHDNLESLNEFNTRLMEFLPREDRNTMFLLANGVWYPQGQRVDKAFATVMNSAYKTDPSALDFGSSKTKYTINDWFDKNTKGLIKDVANDLNCNSKTNIFLGSALYFKGKWQKPFDKSETKVFPFNGVDEVKDVQFMTDTRNVYYKRSTQTDAEMIRLDFRGNGVSTYIILPSETVDMADYMDKFDGEEFEELCSGMEMYELKVRIPKFSILRNMNLSDYLELKKLDIWNCPLTGAGLMNEFNDALSQSTYFKIDEEGVVIAAATWGSTSPFYKSGEFYVDRPFIYLVREESTGAILIAGMIRQL